MWAKDLNTIPKKIQVDYIHMKNKARVARMWRRGTLLHCWWQCKFSVATIKSHKNFF